MKQPIMIANLNSLLTSTPNIRNGRPCITGTAITVHRIAIWYNLGNSAEDIARQYPHLKLDGIYAALSYYHANRFSINAELEADDLEEQRLEAQYTSILKVPQS
jgi:uncharacterized protein (DUF433 family)